MGKVLATLVAVALVVVAGTGARGAVPPCGDVNADLTVDASDGVYIFGWELLGSAAPLCDPAESCADVNGDGALDIADGVYILSWFFRGGPPPKCPVGPPDIEGFTFLALNAQGYPEYSHDATGLIFVRLPGGTFDMGSPEDETVRIDTEGPVHEVTLSPFVIAKYEVTQGQWNGVMGSNPSTFQGARVPAGVDGERLPVETVSWSDVQEFERKTGLGLPTEAQCEYACRGGTRTAFSFGAGESCGDVGCAACEERDPFLWYCGDSDDRTHEVGTKAANPFGLHDVHGNVWEWCEDVFDPSFYSKPEASGADPLCASGSGEKVIRGGSWIDSIRYCRTSVRWGIPPLFGNEYLGFRPAVRLSP